jgi:hypothetical protein
LRGLRQRPADAEVVKAAEQLQAPVADLRALLSMTRFESDAPASDTALSGALAPGASTHVAGGDLYSAANDPKRAAAAKLIGSMFDADGL